MWAKRHQLPFSLKVALRPHTAGAELLQLSLATSGGEKVAGVIFAIIVDRRGRNILTGRDQNTFDPNLRKKRLMTLHPPVPGPSLQDRVDTRRQPDPRQPLPSAEDAEPRRVQ